METSIVEMVLTFAGMLLTLIPGLVLSKIVKR